MDESRAPEIDPDRGRETFLRLVKNNLGLDEGVGPQGKSYLEGPLVIEQLNIREKGPQPLPSR